MTNTPTIRAQLSDLKSRVNPYANKNIGIPFSFSNPLSSPKTYMAIPILVLAILIFGKPTIILNENEDKTVKISYSKLLMYWLIISFVLILGLYGYNYKTAL